MHSALDGEFKTYERMGGDSLVAIVVKFIFHM